MNPVTIPDGYLTDPITVTKDQIFTPTQVFLDDYAIAIAGLLVLLMVGVLVAWFLYQTATKKPKRYVNIFFATATTLSAVAAFTMVAVHMQSMASYVNGQHAFSTQKISEGLQETYGISSLETEKTMSCSTNGGGEAGSADASWVDPSGQKVSGQFDVQRYGDKCLYRLLDDQGNPLPIKS